MSNSLLFLFSTIVAILICNTLELPPIDPLEVKFLADLVNDFSENFSDGNLAHFGKSFMENEDLVAAFHWEINRRERELNTVSESSVLFESITIFLDDPAFATTEGMVPSPKARELMGKSLCQFFSNIFAAFAQEARKILEHGKENEKKIMKNLRGLDDDEFYKYQMLAVTFSELVEQLTQIRLINNNAKRMDSILSFVSLRPDKFIWHFESNWTRPIASLKMGSLENPLETKLLAQMMYNLANKYCGQIRGLAKCLGNDPLALQIKFKNELHETLPKIKAHQGRLFGALLEFELQEMGRTSPAEFGHAICQFAGDALGSFLSDARGTFWRSAAGRELLEARGLDESELHNYELLAEQFTDQAAEFSASIGHTNYKADKLLSSINPETKFKWTIKTSLKSNIPVLAVHRASLEPTKISANKLQVDDFTRLVLYGKCVENAEAMVAHFAKNQQQNPIFRRIEEFYEKIKLVQKLPPNLDKQIFCDGLYGFAAKIIVSAMEKAKKRVENGQNGHKLDNILLLLQSAEDVHADNAQMLPRYEQMAKHFETVSNKFGEQLVAPLKIVPNGVKIVKNLLEGLVHNTSFVFEWSDGVFPLMNV